MRTIAGTLRLGDAVVTLGCLVTALAAVVVGAFSLLRGESPLPDSNRRPLPYHGYSGAHGRSHRVARRRISACTSQQHEFACGQPGTTRRTRAADAELTRWLRSAAILTPLAALLLAAPPATAQGPHRHHATTREYRRSLPAIPPPPHYTIRLEPCLGDNADYGIACADQTTDTVYLGGDTAHNRFVRNHELGHIYDAEVLTASDRASLLPLLNPQATNWACTTDPGQPGYGDDGCPLERFADAYAECRTRIDPWQTFIVTSYGYEATRAKQRRVCGLIAAAGVRAGLSSVRGPAWRRWLGPGSSRAMHERHLALRPRSRSTVL